MSRLKGEPKFDRNKYINPALENNEFFIKYNSNNYTTFVYFITDGEYVKIGYAEDVEKRLKQLQTSNPKKLSILFTIKGDKHVERYLHSYYIKYKSVNEWFKIDVTEIEVINVLNKGLIILKEYSHVKVYTSDFNRLYMCSLPSRAKQVLLWLFYELEENKDYIWINRDRIMKEVDMSKNTLTAALNDLIKAKIIFETLVQSVYWINPLFFFNGNRLEKYKDKIIKE